MNHMSESLNELIEQAENVLQKEADGLLSAETPEQQQVAERIERIQICQKMLRNIRMNLLVKDDSGLNMRVNQLRAVQELIKFLQHEGMGPDFRGRFKQPTGAGKTVLFGIIVKLIGVQTLILVPRTNLVTGTKDEFMEMLGFREEDIGMVKSGFFELGRMVTIATYSSHISKMKRDADYRKHVETCELVICDEAHRSLGNATAESIKSIGGKDEEDEGEDMEQGEISEDEQELTEEEEKEEEDVLANLDAQTNSRSLKLAFTATEKLAQKDVADAFPHLIAEEKQGDMVKAKVLVGYRIIQVGATYATDDFEGYITEEQEADMLKKQNVYGKLAEAYADALKTYKEQGEATDYPLYCVAFCVNIKECDQFAEIAKSHALRARVVTGREAKGKNGDDVIKEAEQQLLDGEIDIIVTVNKLGEGWNFKPMNAAIWARATKSPMIVIQGVGRTCRTYIDEKGREKPYSLVFETLWSLRNKQDAYKVGNKPLTIAEALSLNGENPEDVCSMNDGSKVQIDKYAKLDENGVATAEGVEYVVPDKYVQGKRPYLSSHAVWALLDLFKISRKPADTPYPVVQNGRILNVWLKKDIDAVLKKSVYAEENGTIKITLRDEQGNEIDVEAVHPPVYLEGKTMNPKLWLGHAIKKGLKKIDLPKGMKALYKRHGVAKQKTVEIDAYAKNEVDEQLKVMKIIASKNDEFSTKELGEGIDVDTGDGKKRRAVFVKYKKLENGFRKELEQEMLKRGIQPIPYDIICGSGKTSVLHWEDEIDAILRDLAQQKIDAARQKRQDELDESVRIHRAKVQAIQDKKEQARNAFSCEVQPLDIPGAFHVSFSYMGNNKPVKGEQDVVNVTKYVSPELGRTLDKMEQMMVTRGISTLQGGPHTKRFQAEGLYLKRAIDEAIQKYVLKK